MPRPKDDRLPDTLGGRSLDDPAQLGWALRSFVREAYPINGVPKGLAREVEALVKLGTDLTARLLLFQTIYNEGDEDAF